MLTPPAEPATKTLSRDQRRRVVRALVLGAIALGLLFGFDGSRQPTSGDGWRIIGSQRASGTVNTVQPLPDQAALDAAWKTLYLRGQAPPIDTAQRAVFWITSVGTIGCPSRFNGLHFDAASRTITANFSLAVTMGCDQNRVPDAFLIAIDRDRLPPAPYSVVIAG